MAQRTNNYDIQMQQAKKRFWTYDQQELTHRCRLRFDDTYFYFTFLAEPHRINRQDGNMERFTLGKWTDANTFEEVLTVLDWLCDSRADRFATGRWINVVSHGPGFHQNLQEGPDRYAELFSGSPEQFENACLSLGGQPIAGPDLGFSMELVDGLRIFLQLWHGDEEFPARLRFLWDENVFRYIRYETTWYANALLIQRICEKMEYK